MRPLAVDLLAGCVLGGAPVVFVVWLFAPRLIGGGDWKLLAVLGAALGAIAPASASLVPMAAFGAAIASVAIAGRSRRQVRLGPYLAAGYAVAVIAAVALPDLFGNWYVRA
jgi:prepilin signal peptidase PulO-like enzyme (type II secretory pathway)